MAANRFTHSDGLSFDSPRLRQLYQRFFKEAQQTLSAHSPLLVIAADYVSLSRPDLTCKVALSLHPAPSGHIEKESQCQARLEEIANAIDQCFQLLGVIRAKALYILINAVDDLQETTFCHTFLSQIEQIFPLLVNDPQHRSVHVVYSPTALAEHETRTWLWQSIADTRMERVQGSSRQRTQSRPTLAEFDIFPHLSGI
ncbi:MAG: hypothetical protein IPM37_01665 [Hahellaceae bacterium]|nr:hypothetical protein [Hahellaceae bacterium]